MLPQVTIISVPNTTYQTSATGDGVTTSFGFTWTATEEDQVQVYLAGVLQVSGYTTVLSNITAGGTVFFNAAPTSGVAILLQRSSDLLQNEVLLDNAPLPASTIESMADKLTIICQQLANEFAGTIQLPNASIGVVNPTLPTPVANGIIALNSSGTGFIYFTGPPATAPANSTPNSFAVWDGVTNQLLDSGPTFGSAGQALVSTGPNSLPTFQSVGLGNVGGPGGVSTDYSIALWNGAAGTLLRNGPALAASGTVLTSNGAGAAPSFQAVAGSGNVVGPVTSTPHTLAVWDASVNRVLDSGPAVGTTGQALLSAGAGAAPAFGNTTAGAVTTTAHTVALWDSTTGTLLKDGPAVGTAGQVLTSNGAAADPSFQNAVSSTVLFDVQAVTTSSASVAYSAHNQLFVCYFNGNQHINLPISPADGSVWRFSYSNITTGALTLFANGSDQIFAAAGTIGTISLSITSGTIVELIAVSVAGVANGGGNMQGWLVTYTS